jgi:hypothetical protein
VVHDSKEQPVHGLRASDLIVTENGKRVGMRDLSNDMWARSKFRGRVSNHCNNYV